MASPSSIAHIFELVSFWKFPVSLFQPKQGGPSLISRTPLVPLNFSGRLLINTSAFTFVSIFSGPLVLRRHALKLIELLGFFLRRRLHQSPSAIGQLAYQTFVRPQLEYASSCWNPSKIVLPSL